MPASDLVHRQQRASCGQHPKCHICCGLVESPAQAEAPFYELGYCRLSTRGQCQRCRRVPGDGEVWTGWVASSAGPSGIWHPGGGIWDASHLLTWGEVADAHAALTRLSGSGFDSPSSEAIADHDADLERYRATAVLRAAPGALCNACWALSCRGCGEEMDEAAIQAAIHPGAAGMNLQSGRAKCVRCRRRDAGLA